jgi:signal transduction histidine kinase
MPIDVTLLERLPDPVLMVQPTGDTLYGNRAWHELARRHSVPPRLGALFGPPVQALFVEAKRSGRASAFLPLAVGEDRTQGYRVTVNAESEDGTLAVQLADLSEEVAWRHQLFLRNSELSVLNDIGTALSGTHEFDTLAQRIWEQTGRIMDNANFFIAIHDRDRRILRFPLWIEDGRIVESGAAREFGNGVTEYMLLSRQPLLLNGDVSGQLEQMGVVRPARACHSFLGIPILSEGEALGVLGLMDYEHTNRYGRHELGILNIVATQASAAMRTAWMFEAMRAAYDELTSTQARLMESERLRGVTETVGALNHEVNNPLATIVGTAQLLLRRETLEEDTRTKVERMLEAAKRIQFVTSKMATLIQANSRPYPGQTNILDVLGSVARDEEGPEGAADVLREVRATVVGTAQAAQAAQAARPARPGEASAA